MTDSGGKHMDGDGDKRLKQEEMQLEQTTAQAAASGAGSSSPAAGAGSLLCDGPSGAAIHASCDAKTEPLCGDGDSDSESIASSALSAEEGTAGASSGVLLAVALFDFTPADKDTHCMALKTGDKVQVLQKTNEAWWYARVNGVCGYVPPAYLHVSEAAPDVDDDDDDDEDGDKWQNGEYFGSYSHLKIHAEMLSDRPRTETYRKAIEQAGPYLKDKTVMDVGCGTGILSMFAARAGAAHVYAIEASDMAKTTTAIVAANGLAERITVINKRVEEVCVGDDLPAPVDLIISEWMGTLLIFELMVESVLLARDALLAPGGLVWPSRATLFFAPVEAHDYYDKKVGFWHNQYGFDMTPALAEAKEAHCSRPVFDYELSAEQLLAAAQPTMELDMAAAGVADLEETTCAVSFTVLRDGLLHGFGSWFEVGFCPLPAAVGDSAGEVVLNTGPGHPLTHWKQDLFLLPEPLPVRTGDTLSGVITVRRNPVYRRHLRVSFTFDLGGGAEAGTEAAADPNAASGRSRAPDIDRLFFLWR